MPGTDYEDVRVDYRLATALRADAEPDAAGAADTAKADGRTGGTGGTG